MTPRLTPGALVQAASRVTGMPVAQIKSPSRRWAEVRIRTCIVYIANIERLTVGKSKNSQWSLPNIAKALGRKDHSSIINLAEKWQRRCQQHPDMPALAQAILDEAMAPNGSVKQIILPPKPKLEKRKAPTQLRASKDKQLEIVKKTPVSTYLKSKNNFLPEILQKKDLDAGHYFHAAIASNNAAFVEALLEAGGHCRR